MKMLSSTFLLALATIQSTPIVLNVDATRAPIHFLTVDETIPAYSGTFDINFPQWIPGNHSASGQMDQIVGMHIFSNGKEVRWQRDRVDMFRLHVQVPSKAKSIEVKFNFGEGSSTNNLMVLEWNDVCFFPSHADLRTVNVQANLTVPDAWHTLGDLDVKGQSGSTTSYLPTSVNLLIDHPILCGLYTKEIPLWSSISPSGEHAIDLLGDSAKSIEMPDSLVANLKRLVTEERAVFNNVGHYRKYHWLFTLANSIGTFGLEHHECSDDRAPENSLENLEASKAWLGVLLPHEYFHSWNGKYRRPAGLNVANFTKPMEDNGLWVYEGLTEYYGEVMATRSGIWNESDFINNMLRNYNEVSGPGRTWKPLQDTADFVPYQGRSFRGNSWSNYSRGEDYYPEGSLIWLEADVKIRQLTHGQKSLDDFCRLFHGQGVNGVVATKPFETNEVFSTMKKVAFYDWKTFFRTRLDEITPTPPINGLLNGGYQVVLNDSDPGATRNMPSGNFTPSLGFSVDATGLISTVNPLGIGFSAGIVPKLKIVAVNGIQFTTSELEKAIIAAEKSPSPIELMVLVGDKFSAIKLDYHDGLKIVHFVKDPSKPDVISDILKPLTPTN